MIKSVFCIGIFENVVNLLTISLLHLKIKLLILLQFALNPQVLPFYPRSLLSNSCFIKAADSVGNNDVYGDFARSLEQFCGISNDTAHSSTADDKLHVSRTDSWESWGMPSDFSTSICEPSSASVDAVSKCCC